VKHAGTILAVLALFLVGLVFLQLDLSTSRISALSRRVDSIERRLGPGLIDQLLLLGKNRPIPTNGLSWRVETLEQQVQQLQQP
jgi:polyhydroxyalkanoate synthesis regulator phasin